VRAPIGPNVGADQAAGGADHAAIQVEQRGIVGKPFMAKIDSRAKALWC